MNMGVTEGQPIAGVMGDGHEKIQQKNIVDKEKNDLHDNLLNLSAASYGECARHRIQ